MSSHITLKWAFTAPSVGNLSNNEYIPEKPIHKNPIFEGAISRNFTIFSGLVENLLVSPQNFLAPLAPPRNTKKKACFSDSRHFLAFQAFLDP